MDCPNVVYFYEWYVHLEYLDDFECELQILEIRDQQNGAPFQQENDYMRGYNHVWVGLDDTEKDKLKQAVEFLKIGRPFFFAIDPQNDPDGVVYSIMIQGGSIQKVGADYWQVTMKTEEAIG
jgi:hypothetical protein